MIFGFVVTNNEHEERSLGSMYDEMLFGSLYHEEYEQSLGSSKIPELVRKRAPICSFDQFWNAWEKGKLMAMFDKCWPYSQAENKFMLIEEYNILRRLNAFLDAEIPHPSIWRLRHFLAMQDVSVESATSSIAQAAREYGFSERLDTRTTIELRNFYMELFTKAEPLEIHKERMKGNLAKFAEDHYEITTQRVKEVLQSLL